MADKNLKPHGVPKPKGTAWLKEVRLDAARNTIENLRRQAEERQFAEAKARGITVDEIISKGREDISAADPEFFGDEVVEAEEAVETPEAEAPKASNKK